MGSGLLEKDEKRVEDARVKNYVKVDDAIDCRSGRLVVERFE